MRRAEKTGQIDWIIVALFAALVLAGWLNIYAAVYNEENVLSIFDLSTNSGKQFIWILGSVLIIASILIIDFRFYELYAFYIYGATIALLILVLFFGREVAGSRSWFEIGPVRLQPAEFAKFATALAVSKYLSGHGVKLGHPKDLFTTAFIALFPALLIILQGDTGSALVYSAFIIPMYREGLSPVYLWVGFASAAIFILTLLVPQLYLMIGIVSVVVLIIILSKKTVKNIAVAVLAGLFVIGVVKSVDYVFSDVLKPHQQNRIKAFINPEADPTGYGWNVTQSKIAIGSGGLTGKGYLQGTQTKGDFVPEQSTDFIFCTLGEEEGWIGSVLVIGLFVGLIFRIIFLAERQKSRFARIYGYSVAGIIFFHFAVNIGMTIGLFPVIGIPLPFFSYGGSSLWSFTILLFILVKLDAHRMQVLMR